MIHTCSVATSMLGAGEEKFYSCVIHISSANIISRKRDADIGLTSVPMHPIRFMTVCMLTLELSHQNKSLSNIADYFYQRDFQSSGPVGYTIYPLALVILSTE